jgi:ribosomal protein S18 acetylase RimI-like enzyme
MQVRRVRPEEFEAAGLVALHAYRVDGFNVGGAYDETLCDVAGRVQEADVLVALADDGAIIGTVTYASATSPAAELATADEAEVRLLGVSPAASGRGVGEALVRACIERAHAAGVRQLVLSTQPPMHSAQRLYERLGFVRSPARDWSPVPGLTLLVYALELKADR